MDKEFMTKAYEVSDNATCPRRHVGALIVVDNEIVASGFNSAPAGLPTCYDVGCDIYETLEVDRKKPKKNCVRTVHAEANALLGTSPRERDRAKVYVTDQPCWNCANLLANAGITEIVYHRPYKKDYERVKGLFEAKGIIFRQLENFEIPSTSKAEVIE